MVRRAIWHIRCIIMITMNYINRNQLVSITGGGPPASVTALAAKVAHGNAVYAERVLSAQKWAVDMGAAYTRQLLHPSEAQLRDQRNSIELAQKTFWGTLDWLAAPYR